MTEPLNARGDRVRHASLLALAIAIIVGLANFVWVGDATIYAGSLDAKRMVAHTMVITGKLPAQFSSWNAAGANGTALRVGIPFAAEAISKATGRSVLVLYRGFDLVGIILGLWMLFHLLRLFVSDRIALVGVMFVGMMLPLTFFNYFFHPWDRVSVLLWTISIWLIVRDRLVLAALAITIGVIVKYDAIVLPGVYLIAFINRDNWRRTTTRTAAVGLLPLVAFLALLHMRPDAVEPYPVSARAMHNLSVLREHLIAYPPLLTFALPVAMLLLGWRSIPAVPRRLFLASLLVFVPLLIQTNFIEVRAEIPALLLMLPAALIGMRSVLDRWDASEALENRG